MVVHYPNYRDPVEPGLETLQKHYQDLNLINLITFSLNSGLIASASDDTIWSWCTGIWEYIQKTELDSFCPQLGFNPGGTKLLTCRGAITIAARPIFKAKMKSAHASNLLICQNPSRTDQDNRHGYGISRDSCLLDISSTIPWYPYNRARRRR